MALEIERKFRLQNDDWRRTVLTSTPMRQGYLPCADTVSIRIRSEGPLAYLNLKSTTLGVTRHEFEYPVPTSEALEMMALFCGGRFIDKTRHRVEHAGHHWEIDEFHGANAGLFVAEIELATADEVFAHPGWLGTEVSDDPRYYNVCLIDHPYSQWREA